MDKEKLNLTSSRVKECKCPACAKTLDAATATDRGWPVPKVGDVTICLYCQSVLEWDKNMEVVPITDQTKVEMGLREWDRVLRIVANLKRLKEEEKGKLP